MFNPNEKILNGIGFTISIDNLRNVINEVSSDKKKILLLFKDSYLIDKGLNEQKILQKKGNIAILHLNPCDDLTKANVIMKENNCTEIKWVFYLTHLISVQLFSFIMTFALVKSSHGFRCKMAISPFFCSNFCSFKPLSIR